MVVVVDVDVTMDADTGRAFVALAVVVVEEFRMVTSPRTGPVINLRRVASWNGRSGWKLYPSVQDGAPMLWEWPDDRRPVVLIRGPFAARALLYC